MANTYYDDPGEDDGVKTRSARPKDASTLILIDRKAGQPKLLMGKRARGHDFMPDKYVFPGGRVDPQDGRVPTASELRAGTRKDLVFKAYRRPESFPLAAIRETFEETGLLLGRNTPVGFSGTSSWKDYFEAGAVPCLQNLRFVGRAVTPPYRPKRFDARFFMAEAEDVLIDDRPALASAELVDVRWVDLDEAMELDLPSVTRFMIGEVAEILKSPESPVKPAFLRWGRKGHQLDRIDP